VVAHGADGHQPGRDVFESRAQRTYAPGETDSAQHVGVSAQQVGANALKTYDAVRYAKINHPGDSAANAIFAQAGMAIRSQTDTLLGRCMPVRGMIAVGQSQSAVMLLTYLTSSHPTDKMYDGFLLHTNPSGTTPTSNPNVPVLYRLDD
jgi:Alpha/beta hydrolase domain